jgi:DNA-binding response OmpR family regulator
LLVDDDVFFAEGLAEQLRQTGIYEPVVVSSAGAALEIVGRVTFAAILLDGWLPDFDGRELCHLLRRNGVKTPILMLTSAASDADTILGLNAGADDYIIKPFRLPVLLARLRAQIRS